MICNGRIFTCKKTKR